MKRKEVLMKTKIVTVGNLSKLMFQNRIRALEGKEIYIVNNRTLGIVTKLKVMPIDVDKIKPEKMLVYRKDIDS